MVNNIDQDSINLAIVPVSTPVVVNTSSKERMDELGISTLEPSDKIMEKAGLAANSPTLVQPEFYATNLHKLTNIGLTTGGLDGVSQDGRLIVINLAAFSYSLQNQYYQIIISMLQKWGESIRLEAERIREELRSPALLNRKAAELHYQILAGLERALSEYQKRLQINPSAMAPFMMGSLAIGSTLLGDYLKQITGGANGGNSILSAVTQMGRPLIDVNPALGFFGALFGTGAAYQSGAAAGLNMGRVSPEVVTKQSAREYGVNMMKLIDSADFNLLLNAAVILSVRDGATISVKDREELVNGLKFVLLTTALALIYKSETGKITDMEMAALLTNKIAVNDEPVMQALKNQILDLKDNLGQLKLPMVNATLAYLNSDPKMNELLDFINVFGGITQELSEEVHIQGSSI